MTISTTQSSVTLLGNGSMTVFSFSFIGDAAGDIVVTYTDAGGNQTVVNPSLYTLFLNPPVAGAIWGVGGTVTYPISGPPIANGTSLTIERVLPLTQEVTIDNQGNFYPQSVEIALDTLCLEIQQVSTTAGRAIQFPVADPASLNPILPAAAIRASQYLTFDSLGNVSVSPGVAAGATVSAAMVPVVEASTLPLAIAALGLSGATGSSFIGFEQSGTGAVLRTAAGKFQEQVSGLDYGMVGDGVTDNAAALRNAVASGRAVYLPPGTYVVKSACAFSSLSDFALTGAGAGATVIQCYATSTFTNPAVTFTSCNHFQVSGITFDQNNNTSFSALYPVFQATSCTDFAILENEVIHFTYIGLAAESCSRFRIQDNHVKRDATLNTANQSIGVFSTLSNSTNGIVSGNICENSGIFALGTDIAINNNIVYGNGYGAGINTSANSTVTGQNYVVTGNTCINGYGVDSNSVYVAGMEISGTDAVVSNNICVGNYGVGIATFASQSVFSGNVCNGNGVGAGSGHQAGIDIDYDTSQLNGSRNIFVGNKCTDLGGSTQLYGIQESSASVTGNMYVANHLTGNITAEVLLIGSLPTYQGESYEATAAWTPGGITSGSTVAKTLTVPGAALGQYVNASFSLYLQGCTIAGEANNTNSVVVTITNNTGSTQTLGAGTVRARVWLPAA